MNRNDFAIACEKHRYAVERADKLCRDIERAERDLELTDREIMDTRETLEPFLERVGIGTYVTWSNHVYWLDATDGVCVEQTYSPFNVPIRPVADLTPEQQNTFEQMLRGEDDPAEKLRGSVLTYDDPFDECGSAPASFSVGSLPDLFPDRRSAK